MSFSACWACSAQAERIARFQGIAASYISNNFITSTLQILWNQLLILGTWKEFHFAASSVPEEEIRQNWERHGYDYSLLHERIICTSNLLETVTAYCEGRNLSSDLMRII